MMRCAFYGGILGAAEYLLRRYLTDFNQTHFNSEPLPYNEVLTDIFPDNVAPVADVCQLWHTTIYSTFLLECIYIYIFIYLYLYLGETFTQIWPSTLTGEYWTVICNEGERFWGFASSFATFVAYENISRPNQKQWTAIRICATQKWPWRDVGISDYIYLAGIVQICVFSCVFFWLLVLAHFASLKNDAICVEYNAGRWCQNSSVNSPWRPSVNLSVGTPYVRL